MMPLVILFIMGLVATSSTHADCHQQAMKQETGFDTLYLNAFQNAPPPSLHSQEMRRYVSEKALKRLNTIDPVSGPDIFNFDDFTYSQEYKSAWIPVFKAGPMKIYPVGDIRSGDVSRIFDDATVEKVRSGNSV